MFALAKRLRQGTAAIIAGMENARNTTSSDTGKARPVILMVSGGSDSTALLELATLAARGEQPNGPTGARLMAQLASSINLAVAQLHCLHINHLLRGDASDGDEAFVHALCEREAVTFHAKRINVAALANTSSAGMEATAREQRYLAASNLAQELSATAALEPEDVSILTAHTLDDRAETFLMRALVGTGPGGLGSIPRHRGNILRPLLDATRQELRDFLLEQHPSMPTTQLWREDATNDDGSNFRSRVRMQLMPVMRQLQPGFEQNLARTMDLMAEEDEVLRTRAESIVYLNILLHDDEPSTIPAGVLTRESRPMARRVLRQCLLLVEPEARLEARQIEQIIDAVFSQRSNFAADVASGIRVQLKQGILSFQKVSYSG